MKNVELEKEEHAEKGYSKLQWFLFAVFIPLLFAVTLGLVIMTVAGVNVFEAAQKYGAKIPGVAQFVGNVEKTSEQMLKEDLLQQKATIEEKKLQIKELEKELENKQREIDSLKNEIERLNAEMETKQTTESENEKEQTMNDIIKMYESMSAKNAAKIIPEMSDNDAIKILASLKSETAAEILEKMEPAIAAKYTALLTKRAETNEAQ
jgi:flagellar protein FlbB